MPVQMIELEEVMMVEASDEALEAIVTSSSISCTTCSMCCQ